MITVTLEFSIFAETNRMPPPSQQLSSFGRFELMPMKLSDVVSADNRKVVEAQGLEGEPPKSLIITEIVSE